MREILASSNEFGRVSSLSVLRDSLRTVGVSFSSNVW
jgi:hypothetical protein